MFVQKTNRMPKFKKAPIGIADYQTKYQNKYLKLGCFGQEITFNERSRSTSAPSRYIFQNQRNKYMKDVRKKNQTSTFRQNQQHFPQGIK